MLLTPLGLLSWGLGVLIWASGKSAIHEILSAIIILNGSVLLSAGHLSGLLAAKKHQTSEKIPELDKFPEELPADPDQDKYRYYVVGILALIILVPLLIKLAVFAS